LSHQALLAVFNNLENLISRAGKDSAYLVHSEFRVIEAPNKVETYKIVRIYENGFLKMKI